MEGLKISSAVILGFSDGANIAMKFAIKYPNKVKALILNGGNSGTGYWRTTETLKIKQMQLKLFILAKIRL